MQIQELVENVDRLVSLPEVCVKINEMIDSPHHSITDIGEVIAEDTDLTARLLKTVNSAFYGIPSPVDTISRAINLIGTHDLRDLALMTSACQLFQGVPGELINMHEFWRQGVYTGVIARSLARRCHVLHAERLFVQGVLHDIGRLVIYGQMPETARDILLVADDNDDVQTAAEQDILGFTHADVGYALLQRWRLPESILTSVRFHHTPDQATEFSLETSLIHMASKIAAGLVRGDYPEDSLVQIDPFAWQITGLMDDEVVSAVDSVEAEVTELLELLIGSGASGRQTTH